jgi:hypothetical protein
MSSAARSAPSGAAAIFAAASCAAAASDASRKVESRAAAIGATLFASVVPPFVDGIRRESGTGDRARRLHRPSLHVVPPSRVRVQRMWAPASIVLRASVLNPGPVRMRPDGG